MAFSSNTTVAPCLRSNGTGLYGGEALPATLLARSYVLGLTLPDPNAAVFSANYSGTVAIELESTMPSSCAMVHSVGLAWAKLTVTANGTSAQDANFTYEPSNNWYVVSLPARAQAAQPYTLTIEFRGSVRASRPGLFRSANSVDAVDAGFMLATHLEYEWARTVFPCLDEPSKKALFTGSSVTTPAGMDGSVLLNTDFISIPIPPYLFAVAVGRFAVASAKSAGVEHRVVGPRGADAYLTYALASSVRIAAKLEQLSGVPLSSLLTTLAHVAVPADSGAMENPGLITYENAFLLTKRNSSLDVMLVMAHEMSHLYFGDYVTCADWRELFVNEGMAEFLMYVVTDALEPSWNVWNGDFPITELAYALPMDAFNASSPVTIAPGATGWNKKIVYPKGAAVNRYLSECDPAAYWAGLKDYLKTYARGTATSRQLLERVGAADQYPWLTQPGFPTLSIQGNTVSQDSPSGLLWPIDLDIEYTCGGGGAKTTVKAKLTGKTLTVVPPCQQPSAVALDPKMKVYALIATQPADIRAFALVSSAQAPLAALTAANVTWAPEADPARVAGLWTPLWRALARNQTLRDSMRSTLSAYLTPLLAQVGGWGGNATAMPLVQVQAQTQKTLRRSSRKHFFQRSAQPLLPALALTASHPTVPQDELRAAVLFRSVYFEIGDAVLRARALFANITTAAWTPELQAVTWAVARFSRDAADLAKLKALLADALKNPLYGDSVEALSTGLAGATGPACAEVVTLLAAQGLAAVGRVLTLNTDCEAEAWEAFKPLATAYWKAANYNPDAVYTTPVLSSSSLAAFASAALYPQVTSFLAADASLPPLFVASAISRAKGAVDVYRASSGEPPFVPTPTPTANPTASATPSTAASSTPTPNPAAKKKSSNILIIVAATAGAAVLLIAAGVGYKKYSQSKDQEGTPLSSSYNKV
jgi:hypothetical protein